MSDSLEQDARVVLILGILRSYQHMGRARLGCDSGCECEPLDFDAHHSERNSVINFLYHKVSQSAVCVVSITVLPQSSSGEHKVSRAC
jgi:hypothetical protein